MRFEKPLHWSEGLFLQQHHFQYLQNFLMNRDRLNRELMTCYPWGFLDLDVDTEALENLRVTIRKVTAIFPGGAEISMPGNALIPPLDLKELLTDARDPLMVYLALPRHSDNDGNQAADTAEKRMYIPEEVQNHDDYTGKSEITMVEDRMNVRITTSLQDNADLDLLPVMRLLPQTNGVSEVSVTMDKGYVPPYLLIEACSVFVGKFRELTSLMERRRDRILNDLQVMGYTPEMFSGSVGQSVMLLSILNDCIGRFTAYLAHLSLSPYVVYLDLSSVAMKLSALQPLRNWETISVYQHEDSAPQFNELVLWIRAMLLADGDNIFQRLDFTMDQASSNMTVTLTDDQITHADEYYLAVRCHNNAREIVNAVEKGDNFRMTSQSLAGKRVRGIRLIENRYPPRYFPALHDTVWFKVEKGDASAHIWQKVCEERTIVLDWAKSVFPELEASLFITMVEQGDAAK